MSIKSLYSTILVGALMWVGIVATAHAAPSTVFNFDCVSTVSGACNNGTTNSGTVAGGVNPVQGQTTTGNRTTTQINTDIADIQNYMNAVFVAAGVTNTVTLNKGTKSLRGRTPDETVCGGTCKHPVAGKPYLGNTDGETNKNAPLTGTGSHPSVNTKDTYLINDWNNSNVATAEKKDRIIMTFAKPIPWVATDWEIFPQTSSPSDFTIFADVKKTDGSYAQVKIFYEQLLGTTAVEAGDLGSFAHFDFNSSNAAWLADLAAAGIANGPVTRLEFVDWSTAPIGIDNLQVGNPSPPVPEPASLLLFGSGLIGLAAWRFKRKSKMQ
nr:PEP-CTERM sorting domain-containing protein [Nitrospirota bacterium]